MMRPIGSPARSRARISSHRVRVVFEARPQSTNVQWNPSASSHRLMWSSANGSGMRTHSMPGAISLQVPVACASNGYSSSWRRSIRVFGVVAILDVNVNVRYSLMPSYYSVLLRRTMSTTYTISELAKEFGVTTRTIRYYEDQGLLSPKREGVNRIFTQRDRVRLKLALRGKRLGFSLSEIRELFELYDVSRDERRQLEEFLARLERRRALLEQQREDIEVMLNEINFFASKCLRLLRTKTDDATKK